MRIVELLFERKKDTNRRIPSADTCRRGDQGENIGISARSSCVSRGLMKHETEHGDKSGTPGKKGTKKPMNKKYVKGEDYGGPYPNYKHKPRRRRKGAKLRKKNST